jgi:MEMO1 family protein
LLALLQFGILNLRSLIQRPELKWPDFRSLFVSGLKEGVTLMLSIVGISPHPPIIIPAIGRDQLGKVAKTVDGMKQLSLRVKESETELLVLITPHGQALREGPSILIQDRLKGDFGQFGFPDLQLEFRTDNRLAELLDQETEGEPLNPVFLGDRNDSFGGRSALDHGAMVPLYYLQEAGVNIPGLHITFGFNPYRQLYQFGRALRRAIDRRGLRTAILASGDLSHRLIPGAPAGYSPRGAEFDQSLVEMLREGRVEDILEFDQRLVEEAGECGMRSFIIALGALGDEPFTSEIISYEGPFGVGYLVAALHRQSGSDNAEKSSMQNSERETGNNPGERSSAQNLSQAESTLSPPPAKLARESLKKYLDDGCMPALQGSPAPGYETRAGAFVSIKKDGCLRGCIGTVQPVQKNLAEEIAANAISAALNDPRFSPVSKEELPDLTFSVDVLGPMERVESESELNPEQYGVLVRSGFRSGLLLPDLEGVDTVEKQVAIARQKGNIPPDVPVELYRFKVTRYPEE